MKKTIIYATILFALLAISWYYFFNEDSTANAKFNFAEITRGDLSTILTATGTLEPLAKVEVGTQVSGIIKNLYVDFNDNIRKGQLLAVLDTTFLAASVRDAEAALNRSKAQLEEAEIKFEVNQNLFDKEMISELDFVIAKTSVITAKATVQSASSSLDRANTNFKYAFIRSPINGTVITRNVEQGQTVASSLQAPVLFMIAEDLSRMEILVNVDESDIGQIADGQNVIFTVQTYADEKFEGRVKQIRLLPETIQNVVNYTIVVEAENKKGLLLPGMTATVDFYIEQKKDILLVPNSAIRFKPSQEMMVDFTERIQKRREEMSDSSKRGRNSDRMGGGRSFNPEMFSGGQNRSTRNNMKQVWMLDDEGNLSIRMVFVGLSDGKNTEIVRGRGVNKGDKVITSVVVADEKEEPQNRMPRSFGRGFR